MKPNHQSRTKRLLIRSSYVVFGLLVIAFFNPLLISRHHHYFYHDVRQDVADGKLVIRLQPCKEWGVGRAVFWRNTYWGGTHSLLISVPSGGAPCRITNVQLLDKSTGKSREIYENLNLVSALNTAGHFTSTAFEFPYVDCTLQFRVERLDESDGAIHFEDRAFELKRNYQEFWGSDLVDMLMSA